jgi:hypothetical protein
MEEEPQRGNALTNLVSRGIEAVQSRATAPPSAPSDGKDSRSFNLGGMLKKIGKLREVCVAGTDDWCTVQVDAPPDV